MVLAGNLLAGRYRLDEPVGTGWFSEVWRATDVALPRPVAVKLCIPLMLSSQKPWPGSGPRRGTPRRCGTRTSRASMTTTSRPRGRSLIWSWNWPTGPLWLACWPAVPWMPRGPWMSWRRPPAGRGLQAAHAMGLVHRDIKPGNLLLASSGTVKITDWGISHAIGSVPGPVTGIVTGTAEYLAPERIAGAQAAPASDLYALGVVAYECLAGVPPFVGEPPDVACAHRGHPVPPPPGSVPADVSALVMWLVAKDPACGRPGRGAGPTRRGRVRPAADGVGQHPGQPPRALPGRHRPRGRLRIAPDLTIGGVRGRRVVSPP